MSASYCPGGWGPAGQHERDPFKAGRCWKCGGPMRPRPFFQTLTLLGLLVLLLAACGTSAKTAFHAATATPSVPAHCTYGPGGTPDETCTPGVRSQAVTQANLHQTVCVPGYSSKVRPPVSYTGPLKRRLMASYGDTDSPANYELDHRISISLGGDSWAVGNLFPEHGATGNSKDQLEWLLYRQLCADRITLAEAQRRVLAWPGD
jgi:hypothetical protein